MTARKTTKNRNTTKRATPAMQGWRSSDQDEIERRRQRGAIEPFRIATVATAHAFFGDYRIRSDTGGTYEVEIRSLNEALNACGCPDHAINGLGTCKHIEAVLHYLQKRGKRRFQDAFNNGSPLVEVFLDRRDETVRILWPLRSRPGSRLRDLLAPFFSADGSLLSNAVRAVPALRRTIANAPKPVRDRVRISQHIEPWLVRCEQQQQRQNARDAFDKDLAKGKRSLDVVNTPLYPYQQQGMFHLAFTERALLADDMGLGKTVQAIAACELLRRLRGIARVLVVSPASLKAEWEEQIDKFTGLSSLIVQGSRANRLKQYRQSAFFYLTNYEQILSDAGDIQAVLAPDIVILDEAQRIKNWQTKTATAIKRLHSRYAFVLTGTPLENRIDEIYSIVQFLDPHLFGPLFRFNRDFYELDEKGHPYGYKNLDELHRRLRPVMLRRRKDEVEGDLPARTVNNYFVTMTREQSLRYDDYNGLVARLVAQARRRPLRKEEWEKLQKWLACMRMLCDTPYILDPECDDSPKLEELDKILDELLEEGDHKIIIFSEWTRMLELVCRLAEKQGIDYALHTGAIAQPKRRQEIRRFKDDPDCRLFLSSDSGSTGLNLQNADVVINLDLPWNPAKLEQRIARAWRKHQTRPVQVINLVCEHSIEHRMLHLLDQKQHLAQGVVDGLGELKTMAMPSGRAAFMERMEAIMGQTDAAPAAIAAPHKEKDTPLERLREDSIGQWEERLDLLQVHDSDAGKTVVAVVDHLDEPLRKALQKSVTDNLPGQPLEILDRTTFETIQRLIDSGVLSLNKEARTLHQSPSINKPHHNAQARRLSSARQRLTQAERKHSMAQVLAGGGFVVEALPALGEAVDGALESLARLDDHDTAPLPISFIESRLVKTARLPSGTAALVAQLREGGDGLDENTARALLADGAALMQHAAEILDRAAFE